MEEGGARTNPALGLPFTSTTDTPFPNPGSTHWWRVEGCKQGGFNSRQPSPLFALPFPAQPSSSVLTAVSAAVSVSRAGRGARVLQGVCRSFREDETQGGVVSVDPRPQSSWDSQTESARSTGWILGPESQRC